MFTIVKLYKLAIFVLVFLLAGCSAERPSLGDDQGSFFAKAQEYDFTFESELLIPRTDVTPDKEDIVTRIQSAIKFTLGRMHKAGSIYPSYDINILTVTPDPVLERTSRVKYSLAGKAVLERGLKDFTFYVPLAPDAILTVAKIEKCHEKDDGSVDSNNFWYHWDPDLRKCNLEIDRDYLKIKTALIPVRLAYAESFPEYEQLIDNGALNVSIFYGPSSHDGPNMDPLTSNDFGAKSYMKIRNHLLKESKYAVVKYPEADLRKIYDPKNQPLPYAEIFSKETPRGRITVKAFFLETNMGAPNVAVFHHLLRDALKNDAVVLYSGHSGIGKNLKLSTIERDNGFKITMNPKQQILFLGSCLPYAYYTQMFFDRKKTEIDPRGSKNLDIIVYAKESHFLNAESEKFMRTLTGFMEFGFKFSYRDVIHEDAEDFFGVVGDEDNSGNK